MPLSLSSTRELLTRLGLSPKRFLGQNFLVDGNIVMKSLELAQIKPGDVVVEVGPGLGTLTSALLEAGAEVYAVERDRGLYAHLAETLVKFYPGQLHLMEGDALEHPLAGLPPEKIAGNFKIVANLPYAISTPWMDAIVSGPLPERMVLMLQLEAAQRYAARPGSKQFGAISIFLQSAFAVEPGHKVPHTCFYPKPDVDSALINLVRRPQPFIFPKGMKGHIRACFHQRRKQLKNLVRGKLPDDGAAWFEKLATVGQGPMTRPEAVSVELWQTIVPPSPDPLPEVSET